MFFKSRMKWVGLVGLVLSAFSLFVHILLSRFTEQGFAEYQSSITIFSWRPIFENADIARNVNNKFSQRSLLSLLSLTSFYHSIAVFILFLLQIW